MAQVMTYRTGSNQPVALMDGSSSQCRQYVDHRTNYPDGGSIGGGTSMWVEEDPTWLEHVVSVVREHVINQYDRAEEPARQVVQVDGCPQQVPQDKMQRLHARFASTVNACGFQLSAVEAGGGRIFICYYT